MPTRWRALIGLSCLGLAACTGQTASEPAARGFTEGTRLKAHYLEAEGAPPLFVSWYDTQLGVECLFGDVGLPDKQLCFPSGPVGIGESLIFAHDAGVFSDGGCTQPLFYTVFDQERFVARSPKQEDPCGTQTQLFSLGPELAMPAGVFALSNPKDTSTCHPAPELAMMGLRPLGPEIPLGALVSGTFHPGAGSARIVPLQIVADDGSVQDAGAIGRVVGTASGEGYPGVFPRWLAWDKQRNEAVSDSFLPLAERRWLPNLFAEENGVFADATCSTSAVVGPACPPSSLAYRRALPVDACGNETTTVFELGAPIAGDGQLYYGADGGSCMPYGGPAPATSGTLEAFAPGTPIPLTSFAAVTYVRSGARQLQLMQAASADGPAAYPSGFWDTTHERPCSVLPQVLAADDSFRCLPDSVTLDRSVFADAACSVELASVYPSQGGCSLTPTLVSRIELFPMTTDPLAPYARQHLFPLGDRYLGTAYNRLPDGSCGEVPATEGQELHRIGPELPASDFAAVKVVQPD
ncbi:MAG TPA: hypothetical protein VNG33_16555 [Polyangiaceae bacterium]|nr:hypothetical protein [Polyangiaceae bacterium]